MPRAPQGSVDEQDGEGASWAMILSFGAGALLLVALLAWGVHNLLKHPTGPKRQVAKITLLPDTPPPPPPPPPKEKPPEPKEQVKQVETPKQDKPPEPQQLKMEGPAGDAPSPFQGGEVKQDYIGGDVGDGNGRDKYAYYTDRLVQELQEQLARKNLRNASGQFLLWLAADGSIKQFKLLHSSGSAETDRLIQTAVAELGRVHALPPADMPMPVGLDISTH
jgi:protein TonB